MTVADDYSADWQTTGSVEVGGSATGEIETAGDRDWLAVTFKAGRWYRIDLEGHDAGRGELTAPKTLTLYKPNLTSYEIETTVRPGDCFRPESDITYYLEVTGKDGGTGGYRVSVAEVPDDFAAGTGTTGAVAVGGEARGELEHGDDRDWFKVVLEAGKTYRVDLKGKDTGDGTLGDPNIGGLYDAGGTLIDGTWAEDGAGAGRNARAVFTAARDGVYYIEADATTDWDADDTSPWSGTYALSVDEIPPDLADDASTTGTVAAGGTATGEIERSWDRDWFAVTLEAGKTYVVELKGKDTGDGTLKNPYLDGIYDSNGSFVDGTWDDDGGTGRNSRATVTVEEGGTYYVAAAAAGDAGRGTGTYTLSVTEPPDDFAADAGTTGTVTVDGTATGEIEQDGDSDWFAVTLEAGKAYVIELKGKDTGDGTLEDPYLDGVYDADGNRVDGTSTWDDDAGTGRNSLVTFTAAADGTYYVAAGAAGKHTGTYTLSVTEPPDDFAADAGTTGTVAVGGTATGEIEQAGDVDWFAVVLEAGKTYMIGLKGASTQDGTLGDPIIPGVYDARGTLINGTRADDGGTGRNSLVTFAAEADGTYYVAAGGYDKDTGTYVLSVTKAPDDFAADAGTTGTVAVGGTATGEIERTDDSDWFAVTLEAGKTYAVELKGRPTRDGTLKNPYLDGIYDSDGNLVDGTLDDNGGKGRNSLVTFTAEADGTYYVAAGAAGKHKGTYTLSVTEPPDDFAADAGTTGTVAVGGTGGYGVSVAEVPDDFAAGTGTTGAVAVGGTATGEIERTGDSDWFAVTLEAGKTYRVDLKGKDTGDGTLEDPYLNGLYDADGNRVGGTTTWDDDGGTGRNSLVRVTAEADGTYYVAAGAAGKHKGTYTLSVAEIPTDLAAGTATTGTVAVGGTATGEIERSGDSDWFAVTLEAGKAYVVELKGKDTGDGTLEDPYLDGVYDADGTVLAGTWRDNGGEGRNSLVTFTAEADGTYYVAAGAAGKHKGTYTLSVTEPPDDFAADVSTSGKIAVGGTATGEIEQAGDSDWFAVTLEAGKAYVVELKGKDTGDGTLKDPYLDGIYDSDGTVLVGTQADNGGEGRNSRTTVTVEEGGTYYVAAAVADGGVGTYTLSVAQPAVDPDLAADVSTTGTVTVGGTATGEIEQAGDSDWFAVTLEAGKTYVVELKGKDTGDGTLEDPYLDGIYDSDGTVLAGTWRDNGGEPAGTRAASARRVLRILEPARLVSAMPDWRDWLMRSWSSAEPPASVLFPRDGPEDARWRRLLAEGWAEGTALADDIFAADLDGLNRTFEGIVLWHRLSRAGMASAPGVEIERAGVSGHESLMRIGAASARIARPARFELDANRWAPAAGALQ